MNNNHLRKTRLAMAVASITALGALSAPASAVELRFENSDWQGRLDTTVSVGALFRTESQDAMLAATDDVVAMTSRGFGSQINKNDANNNFDTGLASLVYKITPELDLNWQGQYGLFLRGTAFYDQQIMGGGHDGGDLFASAPYPGAQGFQRYATYSDYANNGIGDDFTSDAERYAGERARILDAYVWGNFDLFERPLNVRLGQQVINWGEALFMQNGVNTANYFDLNALRLPGSEIKEALLPLNSLYFSYGLTFNATVEAFYQFDWKNSEDAPTGTYFSTHDAFPGKGADHVIIDGRVVAQSAAAAGLVPGPGFIEPAFAAYTASAYGADYQYEATQVTVDRIRDKEASESGQFGLAYRYFAEGLNGTEFAVYYTRTHAKTPIVGARLNQINAAGPAGAPETIDTTEYQMAYVEDQDMIGASFNTAVGNVSFAGEIAYRPNRAIINEVGDNLIQNLAGVAVNATPTIADFTSHCVRMELGGSCLDGSRSVEAGQLYYFYDEVDSYNGSLVNIFNFGPTFGSDGLVALLELGVEHIDGLETPDQYYNSTAAILGTEADILNGNGDGVVESSETDDYDLDTTSWGYRAVVKADYSNVFAGVSMSPSVRIAHDVDGNSPIGGNFMEGRKAATLGVNFVYLNNLEVAMSGTTFWGADYSNKLADRNNASVSVKYSF
ncbi:MAG: DUF1302 domain-containing protein [Pseudomonadota bacterium]|uniref:DUF1302 domain-containing protein n=1 Tax=Alcanivorax sp. TaxID=1872427 RepID=UPI0025C70C7E|nr:DUF1302 domain-containing protein [Alcanivorax sp.]MED5239743.1 DUF1302 domain-containing protein [Pseudomonadota bacterium]MEE3321240.1 DUF1302 domain-containing protein [Pseudomonadota bacterium]